MNAPVAESAMVLPEIEPVAPIVRLPFARAVKSPAAPPLMLPLIAIFLPATSISELLLQFTAFQTIMSPTSTGQRGRAAGGYAAAVGLITGSTHRTAVDRAGLASAPPH